MSWLSSATGKDASHNASKAQQQSQQQQTQAASLYSNVGSEGSSLVNMFNSNIGPLLNQLSQAAGLSTPITGTPSAATGTNTAGTPQNTGNTAQGGGKAPTPSGGTSTGQQGGLAGQAGSTLSPQLQAYQANNPSFNPYQLDSNGQAYVSSLIDQVNQQTQSQIQSYNQNLVDSGITDSEANLAGQAYIRQQNQVGLNSQISQFMLQQQQQQIAVAGQLVNAVAGIGSEGISAETTAGGGYSNLSAQNLNFAGTEQQLSNEQMSGVGSLISQFLPGGSGYSALTGSSSGGASSSGSSLNSYLASQMAANGITSSDLYSAPYSGIGTGE